MSGDGGNDMRTAIDLFTEGHTVPDGYDRLLLKATRPDLRTRNGFRWKMEGRVKVPKPANGFTAGVCPQYEGDGLSLAKTVAGMAAGGYQPSTVLVVAVRESEVLAEDDEKVKVSGCLVLDVVDGIRIIRLNGARADLGGADLGGAYLGGAYLGGAYLGGADLGRADLAGANYDRWAVWPDGFDPKAARAEETT